MDVDRREFLRIAGLAAALGFSGKISLETFAGEVQQDFSSNAKALVGKRWALVINLRKCREQDGCRDCIRACHLLHNVPDMDNPNHEIKWIWTEPFKNAFPNQEHEFTEEKLEKSPAVVLCNHCDNPPCVRVCPTKATFKREDGVVMMDQHRCIGCRFCIAACPYGSRSFNWRDPQKFIREEDLNPQFPRRTKGVVEKCNFCAERLAVGLGPACVEACQEGALVFGDLGDPNSEVRELLRSHFTIRRKPNLGTQPQVYYIV